MSCIDRVGFEIEGGWDGVPLCKPIASGRFIADHSINGQNLRGAPLIQAAHVGEAVSDPLPYEKPEEWSAWLLSSWPNAPAPHRTNRTCGFHIHLSTKNLKQYSLLTSKTFLFNLQLHIQALGESLKLPKKHVFWERMDGFNRFCELNFDAGEQMQVHQLNRHNNPTRYGYLNFPWLLHGTVEFRALPTFRDAAVGVRFAQSYLTFVDEYLKANEGRDLSYSTSLIG